MRPLALVCLALAPGLAWAQTVTTTQSADQITVNAGPDAKLDIKAGKDAMGNDVLVLEGKDGTSVNGTPKFEIRLNPGATRFETLEINDGAEVNVDLSGLPEDRRFEEIDVSRADQVTVKNVQTSAGGKIRVAVADAATIEDCDTSNLNLDRADTVAVRRCNVDSRLKIENQDDDADVTVEDTFYQSSQIRLRDKTGVQKSLKARVVRSQGGKVSVQGAEGDDEVSFEEGDHESVAVKLGDGADAVLVTNASIAKAGFDGGAGDLDCFEDGGGNTLGALKQKGFEPAGCGDVMLEYFGAGDDPFDAPPEDAVAWRTVNPANGHADGPFALPEAANPLGLPVLDPAEPPAPAHWSVGPECSAGAFELPHLHDAFQGHGDPDSSACGHGILEWARLVPAL